MGFSSANREKDRYSAFVQNTISPASLAPILLMPSMGFRPMP